MTMNGNHIVMKKWIISLQLLLTASTLSAEPVPDYIEIAGKFDLIMSDNQDQMMLGKYITSLSELTSANSCTLNIIARDNYFNSYPGAIELMRLPDGSVLPFLRFRSNYLDEDGRHRNKEIISVSASVASVATDKNWIPDNIKGQFVLLDSTIDSGTEMFHHLTLGQPMVVELEKEGLPNRVRINVSPLSGKMALLARKCLRLVHDGP